MCGIVWENEKMDWKGIHTHPLLLAERASIFSSKDWEEGRVRPMLAEIELSLQEKVVGRAAPCSTPVWLLYDCAAILLVSYLLG